MSIVRHRRCAALRGQEGKAPTSTSSGLAADGLGRLRRPFGAPGVRAIYVRGVNARVGSRPRSLDGQTDADPGQGCCGDGGRAWLRQPDKRGREVRRESNKMLLYPGQCIKVAVREDLISPQAVPQRHLFEPFPCLHQAITGSSGQSLPPPVLRFVGSRRLSKSRKVRSSSPTWCTWGVPGAIPHGVRR